ncbi:MAG: hypothetical protein CMQ73_02280 [Gammaproteobacteria bacterium]|nr:hypothetical protein [Gammaproteobacteria bacterium]OUT96138.1 MAG: hypothetical protein CBB96_02540 [Gammaproteobacteria bacterium TMED36]
MDPLKKAAVDKCLSFESIHKSIKESELFREETSNITFRINPLTDKPEAAEFISGRFRINISANVKEHPVTGECINQEPYEVISWQINTFSLEEGCETPPDSGINRKIFKNADNSIKYFFKQISDLQSRA